MVINNLIPPGHPAQGVLAYLVEMGVILDDFGAALGCERRLTVNFGGYNFSPLSLVPRSDRMLVTVYGDSARDAIMDQRWLEYSDPAMLEKLDAILEHILPEFGGDMERAARRYG